MPDLPTRESVFGTRALPQTRRSVQGYNAGGAERAGIQAAEGLSGAVSQQEQAGIRAGQVTSRAGELADRAAREADALAEKRNKDREQMDLLKAESYVLEATTSLEDSIRKNQDWAKNPEIYETEFKKISAKASTLVRDPVTAEKFGIALNNIKTRGRSEVDKITYGRELEHYRAEGITSFDNNARTSVTALQQGNQGASIAAIRNQMNVNEQLFRTGAIEETVYAKNKADIPDAMALTAIESLTVEEQAKILMPLAEKYGPENSPGQLTRGNIDLQNRPVVKNNDGSVSTVRSMSFERDGKEILVPTVSDDGRILTDKQAVEQYEKTGKHLGMFKTPQAANKFAEELHKDQEAYYTGSASGVKNFDQASEFVIERLEKTPTVTPDGKGFVRWGINDVANPDINLDTLTKEDAKKLYKERYWDAINADRLPESIRFAAFDSAVVQGVGQTKKWLKESGGDVNKFMELRRAGFEKIGGENLPGWINRLETVSGEIQSPAAGFASLLKPDTLSKKREQIGVTVNSMISDEINNVVNGTPSGPEIAAKFERLSPYGNKETQEIMQSYKTITSDVSGFNTMSPLQISETINTEIRPQATKDGATKVERARLAAAETFLSNAEQQLYKDPISYGLSKGVVAEGLPGADINDPTSLSLRTNAAAAVQTTYEAYGFFTEQERAANAATWGSASPEQKVQMAKNIRTGAGDYSSLALSEFLKDSLPDEYMGGMVASGSSYEDAARVGFFGLDIIAKDESRKPGADIYEGITREMGNAGVGLQAEDQAAMRESIAAIYVGLGGPTNTKISGVDNGKIRKAIRMATGGFGGGEEVGLTSINNKKTILPPLVTGKRFKEALSNADDVDLKSMNPTGSYFYDRLGGRVDAEDIRTGAYYRAVALGEYAVFLNRDDLPLLNQDGSQAVIRINKNIVDALVSKKFGD